MCLLTFFPDGVMPDPDALLNGTTFNDDGHGYAIVDRAGGRIITDRGMDAKDMIQSFEIIRRRYPQGPALFHSRLATDGLISLQNTHPFEVGGDRRTVLAHNGIMPRRPAARDPRSDTRMVAEDWIPRAYGTLRRRRARLAFERWMTPYNKVVILTVDPRYRGNAFLLNGQEGIWEDGIWYSNDAFREWVYAGAGTYTYGSSAPASTGSLIPVRDFTDDHGTRLTCWQCKGETTVEQDKCSFCGLCFDCGERSGSCLCYVPARLDQG